jgi:hypothetical protein
MRVSLVLPLCRGCHSPAAICPQRAWEHSEAVKRSDFMMFFLSVFVMMFCSYCKQPANLQNVEIISFCIL